MIEIKNYIDALNATIKLIAGDNVSDEDIQTMANFLYLKIMEDDSPDHAASDVYRELMKRHKAEKIRIECNYNVEHSTKMAHRFAVLLYHLISKMQNLDISVDEDTLDYYNHLNTLGTQPQALPEPKKPKTFRDRVANNIDANDLLRKLHIMMDNKSGKDALVYLATCIADGKLNRPTFSQFQKEFPNICEKAEYYRYTDKKKYTPDELTAARIAFNNCK